MGERIQHSFVGKNSVGTRLISNRIVRAPLPFGQTAARGFRPGNPSIFHTLSPERRSVAGFGGLDCAKPATDRRSKRLFHELPHPDPLPTEREQQSPVFRLLNSHPPMADSRHSRKPADDSPSPGEKAGMRASGPWLRRGRLLTVVKMHDGGVIHQLGRSASLGSLPSLVNNSETGIRASVEHTLFWVQLITVTPYFPNCSSVVTTVKSCSLAAAIIKRSHGSLWIGGSWAAAMQTFNSSGRTASP